MILVPCPFWRVWIRSSNNACLIALIFSSSFFNNAIASGFLSKSTCCFSFIDLKIVSPPLNFCWIWLSRNLKLLWYSCTLVATGPMSNIASSSFVLSLKGFVLLDHSSWLFLLPSSPFAMASTMASSMSTCWRKRKKNGKKKNDKQRTNARTNKNKWTRKNEQWWTKKERKEKEKRIEKGEKSRKIELAHNLNFISIRYTL